MKAMNPLGLCYGFENATFVPHKLNTNTFYCYYIIITFRRYPEKYIHFAFKYKGRNVSLKIHLHNKKSKKADSHSILDTHTVLRVPKQHYSFC